MSIGSHQNVNVLPQMNRMSFKRAAEKEDDNEDEVIEQRIKRKTNRM